MDSCSWLVYPNKNLSTVYNNQNDKASSTKMLRVWWEEEEEEEKNKHGNKNMNQLKCSNHVGIPNHETHCQNILKQWRKC